jgi:hypothetical protein
MTVRVPGVYWKRMVCVPATSSRTATRSDRSLAICQTLTSGLVLLGGRRASLRQLSFEFFNGRQGALQIFRKGGGKPELRDADRLLRIAKSVFDEHFIVSLAEYDADARLIVWVFQEIVDGRKIEVHFAGVFRLEVADLQIDNDEAPESRIVKEEIEAEIFPGDFERVLTTEKCETLSEFQEKLPQVFQEAPLDFAFLRIGGDRQKIEVVRILEKLLREIRLWRRKSLREFGQGLSLPAVQFALDLHHQNIPAPTVLHSLLNVPKTLRRSFHQVEKPDIVAPRNLSNNLLDNYFIGPSFRKSAHIEQVRPREPFHFRKSLPQIGRQVINDLCSPANQFLSLQDVPAECQ